MTEGIYLNEDAKDSLTSRRKFLAGSAAALAGGTLLAVPGVAKAHNPGAPTDLVILNYALTLERLEATFYRRVLNKFGEREFERSAKFNGLGKYLRSHTYENFKRISRHENTHVAALVSTIRSLGGEPVPPSDYDFGIKTVGRAVSTAQVLENTGVMAYDGAIAHIEAALLLTTGATIATVEARHASYLNLLNRDVPFPSAFDQPKAPRKICEAVKEAYITSSPKPYGPYSSLQALCDRLPNTPTPS